METQYTLNDTGILSINDTLIVGGVRGTVTGITDKRVTVRREDGSGLLYINRTNPGKRPVLFVVTAQDVTPTGARQGRNFLMGTPAYRLALPHLREARGLFLDAEATPERDAAIRDALHAAARILLSAFAERHRPQVSSVDLLVSQTLTHHGEMQEKLARVQKFMAAMAPAGYLRDLDVPDSPIMDAHLITDAEDNVLGIIQGAPEELERKAKIRFGSRVRNGFLRRTLREDEMGLYLRNLRK